MRLKKKFSRLGLNLIIIAGAFYLFSNWHHDNWAIYVAGLLSLIGIVLSIQKGN